MKKTNIDTSVNNRSNMNILVFDKGNNYDLTPNLALSEVKCRCSNIDCTRTLILKTNILTYQKVRDQFNEPIRVTSGYRCQLHNRSVGGNHASYHMIGAALDLTPWDFDQDKLDRLEEIAKKHFDVVIRYNEFVHCHNYGDKEFE